MTAGLYTSFVVLRIRRPPRSTRTDTSFPTRRCSDLHPGSRGHPSAAGPAVGRARRHAPRPDPPGLARAAAAGRTEKHTSELQSLMRIAYAVLCLKKKKPQDLEGGPMPVKTK